jgi:hypothetical protein
MAPTFWCAMNFLQLVSKQFQKCYMDSTSSPKVKIAEGEWVGAYSLTRNTSRVKGHVGTLRWDYVEQQAVSHAPTQTKQQIG